MALAYMGLKPMSGSGKLADSADPTWLDRESPPTVPVVSSNHDSAAKSNVSCFSTPVVPHVSETQQPQQLAVLLSLLVTLTIFHMTSGNVVRHQLLAQTFPV